MRALPALYLTFSLGLAQTALADTPIEPAQVCESMRKVASAEGEEVTDAEMAECVQKMGELRTQLDHPESWNQLASCLQKIESEVDAQKCFEDVMAAMVERELEKLEEELEAQGSPELEAGGAYPVPGGGASAMQICTAVKTAAENAGNVVSDEDLLECTVQMGELQQLIDNGPLWSRFSTCMLAVKTEDDAMSCVNTLMEDHMASGLPPAGPPPKPSK